MESVVNVVCDASYSPNPNAALLDARLGLSRTIPATVRFSEPPSGPLTIVVKFHLSEREDLEMLMRSASDLAAVGFGTETYYMTDASHVTKSTESSHYGRFRFYPILGEQHLDPEKALGCPPNFHLVDLQLRLKKGPVEFRFETENAGDHSQLIQLGILSIGKAALDNF